MRFLILFMASIILLLIMPSSEIKKTTWIQDQTTSNAHSYLQALTHMGQFNGVVLLAKGDSILMQQAYTTSKYDLPTLSITTQTRFDLRSISKLFVKAVLTEWIQQQRFDLDTPLSHWFPQLSFSHRINLEQLMNHTSGLPREIPGIKEIAIELDDATVLDRIGRLLPEFEPGTDTLYSNPGYQLLYQIIGKEAGKPYPQYLRERYFRPLGMTGSGAHFYDNEDHREPYGYGHFLKNDSLQALIELDSEDMRTGHLYATAEDLFRFITYLRKAAIANTLAEDGVITHSGGSRGKRAWVYTNVANGNTIVFLSNIDMIPFEAMTKDLISLMEGDRVSIPQPISRKEIAIDPNLLKAYAGTYDFVDAGHLILEFRFENDSLVGYQKGKRAGVLRAENNTTFFWDPESSESIQFLTQKDTLYALMDFQGVKWKGERIGD